MAHREKRHDLTEKEFNHFKLKLAAMMSDVDIKRYLGDNEDYILRYCQLRNYNTIDELLPVNGSFKVILTEDSKNHGHWCCILRQNNIIEWFDPIGVAPDYELSFIPKSIKCCLGEDKHYLTHLLKRANWLKVIWNKMKLQRVAQGINTCGRHCVLRIILMKMGLNLKQFQDIIQQEVEDTEMPSDVLVCDWIK